MCESAPGHRRLTLYGRQACGLCQDMNWQLQQLEAELNIRVDWVEIDSDPGLVSQFGVRIPVLMAENVEICHYTLDMAALNAYLDRRPSPHFSPGDIANDG